VIEIAERLATVIDDRAGLIEKQTAYYTGERPRLVLADTRIPAYNTIVDQARTPWAELVIDQAAERLAVTGFRVLTPGTDDSDVEADTLCWDIWQASQADLYSQIAFQTMLLHASAYILVEAGPVLPVLSFEHPSTTAVMPSPGGRTTAAAMKRWMVDDRNETAVLWTPGSVQVLTRDRGRGTGWTAGESTPGPAAVPVFAMRNRPDLLGGSASDLDGLYPTLDRAAQSIADRITTQLYAATKVRYLIGVEAEYDEDGRPTEATLSLATDRLLLIDNPEAKAGVFEASDLRQFIEVSKADISALAALSRLPTYLLSGDLVNVSREALESLSQGLVSRVEQRQVWASAALSDAMRMALGLAGDERVADPRTRVEPIWAAVVPPSPTDTAQAASVLVQAGILSPTGAQDMVLGLTPSQLEKAAQYTRSDALAQQGVSAIGSLFTDQALEPTVA
jgi:hypothetical protein